MLSGEKTSLYGGGHARHDDEVPPQRERHPDALGQPPAGSAGRSAATTSPRDEGARRPGRPVADLPDGPDPAGGLAGAGDRDPRGGARRLQAVAADTVVSRTPPRAGA